MQQERDTTLDSVRIDQWLAEDLGPGDITTRATLGADRAVQASWIAKADGIVAGLAEARAVFQHLDPQLIWQAEITDGVRVRAGQTIATLAGTAHGVLSGERLALNIVQRMSGIATETRRYVDAVAGYSAQILDTRKTVPGLRDLDKKAVAAGGGTNHRFGLYDLAMIKDNHIAAAGGIAAAVAAVRGYAPDIAIEVETTSLAEVDEALAAEVPMICLLYTSPSPRDKRQSRMPSSA